MDTKWKKWKIILEFTAFFSGITLLICSLLPALGLFFSLPETRYGELPRAHTDYQELAEFRTFIADRLEELLGIATGGKGWKNYGVAYGDAIGIAEYNRLSLYEGEETAVCASESEPISAARPETGVISAADAEAAYQDWLAGHDITAVDYSYEDWLLLLEEQGFVVEDSLSALWDWDGDALKNTTPKLHMAELAKDKNLRYAVIYQNKLLYTNIDGYEDQINKTWDGGDFSTQLSAEEYNFSLWFNKGSDGKVQITKDGKPVDVYGNGVYTDESLWFVPGYTNFSIDESTKEAVIFLAAAKEPRLYVVGNYADNGSAQYGGRLYYIRQNLLDKVARLRFYCILLGWALALLLLAFLLRKQKSKAHEAILRLTGRLFLELKFLLFLLLPLSLLLPMGARLLRTIFRYLRESGMSLKEGGGYLFWELGVSIEWSGSSFLLALIFWLLYFGILDLRGNRGRHKKLILGSLRTKDLNLPLQKKMVKRYRLALISGLLLPLLVLAVIILTAFPDGWGLNQAALYTTVWDGSWESSWEYCGEYGGPGSTGALLLMRVVPVILLLLLVFCGILFVIYAKQNRRLAEDIAALTGQIGKIREGGLTEALTLPEDSDLKSAAQDLNELQQGMETALQRQMRSERMKVELVSNVSHDIKTPLTSIISYVELLKQEENLPEHVKEFIRILGEKSERLKSIVQDVFEISKATSGQLSVKLEELDLAKLLRQTLADMSGQIEESGLTLKLSLPEEPVPILADGQRLYRVFQNLLQNALKYSLAGSRVFLSLTEERGRALVRIRNTSGTELDDTKDFTERFVRGDASRTDGGSGLGLSIAKSFTEACGGSFRVETDADLFTVSVSFPQI